MDIIKNRVLVDFTLFYKTLVPVLYDFGINMDKEQAKKFIKCILTLIGLFCVKNTDKYFKVGNLRITRMAKENNLFVVDLYKGANQDTLNNRIINEFNSTLVSSELTSIIENYFKSVAGNSSSQN